MTRHLELVRSDTVEKRSALATSLAILTVNLSTALDESDALCALVPHDIDLQYRAIRQRLQRAQGLLSEAVEILCKGGVHE